MKKAFTRSLLFCLFTIGFWSASQAQTTVNTSVFWTTGWCSICNTINGGQYACESGSGSPQWNNGIRNFSDPVPAGNNVTQVCATVNYVCCGLSGMTINLNGVPVGTFSVPSGCNCNCSNCYSNTVCITNPPNYNYGGQNTIQVVNNGGNSCVNSVQIAITYALACNVPISNNNITANQTICSNNLAAALSGSLPGGGNGIYAYQWLSSSNNSTWAPIPNATAQNYAPATPTSTLYFRRRVFSQPGCVDTTTSIAIYVQNPILNNIVGNDQTICASGTPNLFTGTVPTGGLGTYTYSWEQSNDNISWSPAPGGAVQNYQSGPILTTAYFRRVVTSGVCAANTSAVIQITLYPRLGDNIIGANQTICTGSQPANITGLIPTGGSGAYNFQWQSSSDNIVWNMVNGGVAPSYQPPVLTQNFYFRRLVTSPPCVDTSNVVAIQVNQPIGNNIIINDQTICAGVVPAQLSGSVATGGSGLPTYTWESSNNAITWAAVPGGNSIHLTPPAPGATIYYRRLISDGPCPTSTSNTITIVVDMAISNNVIGNNQTICEGATPVGLTGTLPAGGNSVFTYAWESGPDNNIWIPIGGSNVQNYIPGALNSTVFFRRIVTSGTCIPNTAQSVMITVEPLIGNNTITSSQTICDGSAPAGFVGANPSGGSGVYSYSWESSPDNLVWNVIPSGNTISYSEGTLNANVYYRRIVSSGVCNSNTSASIHVLVNINPSVVVNNVAVCFGQSATLTANGNIPGGTYLWTTGQVTQTISVQPNVTTTYTVVYTLNNCPSQPADGVVTINTPALPNITPGGSLDLCPNATVSLTSDPGVNYLWSHDNSINAQTVTVNNTGTYAVTVTDVNGCISTSLPVQVTVHTEPIASTTSTDARCFGDNTGTAFSDAVNGTLPYNFTWNTVPVQSGQIAYNLTAGTYIVTVTDLYGCTGTAQAIIGQPTQLMMLPFMESGVSCYGGSDAVATALVNGGTPPYSFTWNTSPVQTTQTVSGLAAGVLTLSAMDANGCVTNGNIQITEPNQLVISPNINPVRCYGEENGAITAVVGGGTPAYFYNWSTSPSQTTPTAINLPVGNYQVTVTDGNGCSGSASFTMTQPDTLIARASYTDAICSGESSGTATAIVSGGNGSYGYLWNSVPAQETQIATGLPAGIYLVTVYDPKGCVDTARAYIGQPQPVPFPVAVHDSVCPGQNATMAAYADPGLKINWYSSPNDQTPFFTGTKVNIPELYNTTFYQIESEDSKGCKSPRFPVFAWVYNLPVVDFIGSPLQAELPDAIVDFVPAQSMDRNSIYSWSWDFGDGGQTSQFIAPSYQYGNEGSYDVTLTVVDTNGCINKAVKKAYVEVNKVISVFVPNAFSPNGDGVNDYFSLEYRLIDEFVIVIYDRWGNQVYTSFDPKFHWDGTANSVPAPDGTYVYVIKGKGKDGTPVSLGGNVILIR